MKFTIITHVAHIKRENQYFGYSPYIREMNIWLKYVDEVIIVAPLSNKQLTEIEFPYQHDAIHFRKVSDIKFVSLFSIVKSAFKLPLISIKIFRAMQTADHIHLRCPGNMGLLGSLIQIFFPKKSKTAKYAGNWDPKSKQPWTYRLQKYILSNTFLTRNMQVLVYGEWENQSKNIKPFFTATYSESEKESFEKNGFDAVIEFVFVGSLVSGKRPLYAIQLMQHLIAKGENVILNLFGEGDQRSVLEEYIAANNLEKYIFLNGNQNKETIKKAYQKSHFVLLPSKSEGWPKAIAEGMFWGCVPIATNVSCVANMLDFGKRGILLEVNLERDCQQIQTIIKYKQDFFTKSTLAKEWSQEFTTDLFENEIKKLLEK